MRKLTARALPHQLPGYPDYLAALLYARGISDVGQAERYLNPDVSQLHDPFLMHGMAEAVNLVKQAAAGNQACVVYGDYDADGVC
ncbi:MAG TPA: single-stranded-DNA-specific exonuclease RecJ, partial [Clostridia bacterium]|nr:single-stranded-DNA-specific exonuclease RecJ [Clostridia bacterium]